MIPEKCYVYEDLFMFWIAATGISRKRSHSDRTRIVVGKTPGKNTRTRLMVVEDPVERLTLRLCDHKKVGPEKSMRKARTSK